MTENAVIDRFEEEWAVLLVGEQERRVNVPRDELPSGAREGHWLRVELDDERRIVNMEIDEEETARTRERIADKLARLRRGEHLKSQPFDATLVEERMIPRGTEKRPGQFFLKVWTVKNTGERPWSKEISLARTGGDALGTEGRIPLPDVEPGEEYSLRILMRAPEKEGTCGNRWRLCREREYFGPALSVEIVVRGPTPTAQAETSK
ncbi:MAG: NBR1-Ig-like domain-containing protein [Anaerolineales bacterium]